MKVSYLYENYKAEAEQHASGYGITPQSTPAQCDTFRHAYASAAMANEFGGNTGKAFANFLTGLSINILR